MVSPTNSSLVDGRKVKAHPLYKQKEKLWMEFKLANDFQFNQRTKSKAIYQIRELRCTLRLQSCVFDSPGLAVLTAPVILSTIHCGLTYCCVTGVLRRDLQHFIEPSEFMHSGIPLFSLLES